MNVNFTSDVKRPVDLHVDVLNAKTKEYYAGKWEEFDTQAGSASLTITMAKENVYEPFLWKVFLTPRGEPFPNMLAETGTCVPISFIPPLRFLFCLLLSSIHFSLLHPSSLSVHARTSHQALSLT